MTRLLLTGAGGLLGSHLAPLVATRHQLLTASRKPIGESELEGDLGDDSMLAEISKFAPEVVLHLAALTDAALCQQEVERARRTNVELTGRLARAVEPSVVRFVYTSTDLVFDGHRGTYRESELPAPVSVYGETKLQGEREARSVLGRRLTVVRLALLYGARRNASSRASFAETMIEKAARGSEVLLFTDELRSPLYLEDAASGLARLVELEEAPELLHFGGPERCSRFELGTCGLEVFDLPRDRARAVTVSEAGLGAPRPRDVSLDSTLARRWGLAARDPREGFLSMKREMERGGFVVGSRDYDPRTFGRG